MYIFAIIVKSYRYAMNMFIYYREAVYPYAKMLIQLINTRRIKWFITITYYMSFRVT